MTTISRLAATSAILAGILAASPSPRASVETATRRTVITFSGAVALPGTTLPAGTYNFELIDPLSKDVVIVRSASNPPKLYFMGMTNRVARPAGMSADQLIDIGEPRRGTAPPVLAWFPPDAGEGYRFHYSNW
jgi:hypothetical protein